MASKAHRWPAGDTPLTGSHGGTANAAREAIQKWKRDRFEEAKRAAREVIERARKDRMRPRRRKGTLVVYPVEALPFSKVPILNEAACRAATKEAAPLYVTRAEAVWAKTNGLCTYCDKPMLRMQGDPLSFTIDHKIPKSRNGSNRLSNLIGAHAKCNNEKGNLTDTEYRFVLQMRARKPPL